MSDYLVNLARRGAGLAGVIRARSAPVIDASDAQDATVQPVASPEVTPAPSIVMMPMAAPTVAAGVEPHAPADARSAPPTIALAQVAQRSPSASVAPVVSPAAAVGRPADAIIAAPRVEAPARREDLAAIMPAAIALADVSRDAHDDEPRAQPPRDELRVPAATVDRVIATEAADGAPVVVTIQPAEQPAVAVQAPRAEPVAERTVHVRIGAIEIYAADDAARASAAVAPIAATPAAGPASSPGGFDDFAALRSYAPWGW